MKQSIRILAAGIALFAANASSNTPRETVALPAAKASAAPWLVAQDRRMPSCQVDNREVPVGTTSCREGRLWVCERSGWATTGKPC